MYTDPVSFAHVSTHSSTALLQVSSQYLNLLLFSFLLSSCVPIPYASPPLKASIGLSSAQGTRNNLEQNHQEDMNQELIVSTHLSLHPFSLANRLDRSYDLGIGYFMSNLNTDDKYPFLSGPFIQGQSFINVHPFDDAVFRWGVIGRGGLLFANQGPKSIGWTASMGVMLEYVAWNQTSPFTSIDQNSVDHDGNQTHLIGIAHGEGGVGLELLGSLQKQDINQYWTITLGFVFELPATIGVLLVPLNGSDDSEDESSF